MTNLSQDQVAAAREIIGKNAELLEQFVVEYLLDSGIRIQLVEAIAREEIFGQQGAGTLPKELVDAAIADIVDAGPNYINFSLESVLDSAASLEFLVRWARRLHSYILPPQAIPNDDVVNAALIVFHEERRR